MHIIFITPLLDPITYSNIQHRFRIFNPGQNFYSLMYQGFKKNNVSIDAFSFLPEKYQSHVDSASEINYVIKNEGFINSIKSISVMKRIINPFVRDDSVIIVDAESFWGLKVALRFKKLKVINVVTDFPEDVASYSEKPQRKIFFYNKAYNLYTKSKLLVYKKADAFVLLTKQMKQKVALKKPSMVMEGLFDIDQIESHTSRKERLPKNTKTISYLGALNAKSGILDLIEAFSHLNDLGVELQIYGDGDYVEKIKENNNPKIHYYGVVSREQVLEIERNSDYLINPRPSRGEFNKYSFPSKILEYMASGTPVITTRLAGIPNEYDPFLFYIDDLNPETMAGHIRDIVLSPPETIRERANAALEFVSKEKNSRQQTKRIMDFINSI